jgi:serine protease inhibitor
MPTNIGGSDTTQSAVSRTPPPSWSSECNRFTARWCSAAGNNQYVVSGACTWPALLLLESAAAASAAQELAGATGVDSARAQASAAQLVDTLTATPGVHAAVGLWTRADLPLEADWLAGLPDDVVGRLTGDIAADQRELDGWARAHTEGVIPQLPVRLGTRDILVLASALVAKTSWRQPFQPAPNSTLTRRTAELDDAVVLSTPSGRLTRVVVSGDNDVDVQLIAGEVNTPASEVLPAAIQALEEFSSGTSAGQLPVGYTAPCLTVSEQEQTGPADQLILHLPAFEVRSNHDLTQSPDVFGLSTALDSSHGHFPKLSPTPLALSQAASSVTAIFSASGFEAAAVTAVTTMRAAVIRERTHLVRRVDVVFDRPFGFLAVHRPTRLVVAAGWVAPRG